MYTVVIIQKKIHKESHNNYIKTFFWLYVNEAGQKNLSTSHFVRYRKFITALNGSNTMKSRYTTTDTNTHMDGEH